MLREKRVELAGQQLLLLQVGLCRAGQHDAGHLPGQASKEDAQR